MYQVTFKVWEKQRKIFVYDRNDPQLMDSMVSQDTDFVVAEEVID